MACTLAWDYEAVALAWRVDQCDNHGPHCDLAQVATLPGDARTVEIGSLAHRHSFCWQVRLPSGQVSNLVCSP
jgi:hypothetical protein